MRRTVPALTVAFTALAAQADAAIPLSYMTSKGAMADPVLALDRGMLTISIVVVVIVTALVVVGVIARRAPAATVASVPVAAGGNGLRWIWLGVGISSVPLLVVLFWTVAVLAAIKGRRSRPVVTIEITGQQWWWKARYLNDDAAQDLHHRQRNSHSRRQPVRIG